MARPQKEGLDYFPLDVDMDQDDKILLIEAKHKITGFAVLVKLLMKIYKEGYFYRWTEREQLLFSNRINVDPNIVGEIINDCIKWELFDLTLYEKYNILTSSGIQKRYIEAIKRRKEITLIVEYLMVPPPIGNNKFTVNLVNADINRINVNINPINGIHQYTKESKVKKSKVKNISSCPTNKFADESIEFILACELYSLILGNNSGAKKPNFQVWAKSFDLMIRRDERSVIEIREVMRWSQKDIFWHTNILSPDKLRKQFEQLTAKMKIPSLTNKSKQTAAERIKAIGEM